MLVVPGTIARSLSKSKVPTEAKELQSM
jgi:hypothetical protein